MGLVMTSCNSEDDSVNGNQALSEEEAVEIVEASLAQESAGLEEITYSYTQSFQEIAESVECNETITDGYVLAYNGNLVEADYTFNWEFTITCNAFSIPQSAAFSATGDGTYETQNISSEDASAFDANITGLQPSSTVFVYNGDFLRSGSQEVSIGPNTRQVNTDFSCNIQNLTVGKDDFEVDSGNGSFSLIGVGSEGAFSVQGTIVFNGNNTATVTINGNSYTISI